MVGQLVVGVCVFFLLTFLLQFWIRDILTTHWFWLENSDPHFGIPVCMPAFREVPFKMRQLMSDRYLNGTTRFLGGSADTLYIPERLKDDFLYVLGLFLNTSCFLEIAVPTTVHLIIPENDTILFVDHVSRPFIPSPLFHPHELFESSD